MFLKCVYYFLLGDVDYFKRNKRITKSLLGAATTPFWRRFLLRLVDFLVRMCRLKDFWKVISPVPVTLKRFFALEFVLTLGIIILLRLLPAGVSALAELLLSLTGIKILEREGMELLNMGKAFAYTSPFASLDSV